jgi:hypothetical protein
MMMSHEVSFVLDQHAELDFYSAISLKQQSTNRHVAPLGHIILIPSQSDFSLFSLKLVLVMIWLKNCWVGIKQQSLNHSLPFMEKTNYKRKNLTKTPLLRKWPYKKGGFFWGWQFNCILLSQCIWNLAWLEVYMAFGESGLIRVWLLYII